MFLVATLNTIDDFFSKIEKTLLVLFGLALTLIMMSQVILRYFFNSPIFWAEEIAGQFLVFMTVFGISHITKINQHISIDFLLTFFNEKIKKKLSLFLGFLFLALMSFVCYYAWEWVFRSDVQMETSGTTGLPRWYTYIALPIAFSFLCWHQMVLLVNEITNKRQEG